MTTAPPPKGRGRTPKQQSNNTGNTQPVSTSADPQPRHLWSGSDYGRAALDDECTRILDAARGNRNNTVFLGSLRMGQLVGAELNEDYAERRLLESARRIGLGEADARRQVRNGLAKGRLTPRRRGPSPYLRSADDARRELEGLRRAVDDPALKPVTRRILAAFHALANHAGKLKLSASLRQISEAAGVAPSTITKHLEYIQPWVSVASAWDPYGPDAVQTSTTWQIHAAPRTCAHSGYRPEATPSGTARLLPECADPPPSFLDPDQDQWFDQPCKWAVARTLWRASRPLTAREVAAESGVSLRTAQKALAYLDGLGLIDEERRGRGRRYSLVGDRAAAAAIEERRLELDELPPGIVESVWQQALRGLRQGRTPSPAADIRRLRAWAHQEALDGRTRVLPFAELRRREHERERREYRQSIVSRRSNGSFERTA